MCAEGIPWGQMCKCVPKASLGDKCANVEIIVVG
jgi:hypothetical protein